MEAHLSARKIGLRAPSATLAVVAEIRNALTPVLSFLEEATDLCEANLAALDVLGDALAGVERIEALLKIAADSANAADRDRGPVVDDEARGERAARMTAEERRAEDAQIDWRAMHAAAARVRDQAIAECKELRAEVAVLRART